MWNKGDILPLVEKEPITKEKLREYALASGDTNPIHLDEAAAKEAGFPTVIVHGMISMAFIADYIVTFFPNSSYKLNLLKSKFKKVTFPGEKLRCGGIIKDICEDGTTIVLVEVKNEMNEVITEGKAYLKAI